MSLEGGGGHVPLVPPTSTVLHNFIDQKHCLATVCIKLTLRYIFPRAGNEHNTNYVCLLLTIHTEALYIMTIIM